MNKKLLFLSVILLGLFTLLTSSKRDPNNPPTGKTGAPAETTCAQSGCHSGGAYTGTVTITGVPDTVVYNQTYPITLKNASNAVRAGFELTCLDSVNVKCGTLTSATGVSIGSGSNRQYARQSTPKNLSGGSASWTFNWKAPATAAGKKATFYFVSLCANGNGGKSGDNVLLGTKAIVFASPASGTSTPLGVADLKFFPTQATDFVQVELLKSNSGKITIFDLSGKIALQENLDASTAIAVSTLKPGAYWAKIETSAGSATKKFIKL